MRNPSSLTLHRWFCGLLCLLISSAACGPAMAETAFPRLPGPDNEMNPSSQPYTTVYQAAAKSIHPQATDEQRLDTVDAVKRSAVASNLIAQPRITTEALYRLSPLHGQSIDWKAVVPEGSGQNFQKLADQQLYLQIRQREPRDSSIELPMSDPRHTAADHATVPSFGDEGIHALARQVVGSEKRTYFAARLLQRWVYDHVARKDLSLNFADARETLQKRQGDCTEQAVLLTTLTRSLGIPSRVAAGMIYQPNGGDSQVGRFNYHTWTEIYLADANGREWVALDATQPEPLVDAAHIKLADSNLTAPDDLAQMTQQVTELMGRVKVDVLKAMSSAQSVLDLSAAPEISATPLPKLDLQAIDIRKLSERSVQRFRVELPPQALSRDSADGLFTLGLEALSKENFWQSQADFEKALTQLRHPIALYRLGERLAGIEQYPQAKEAFQRAAEKDPRLSPLVHDWLTSYIPRTALPDELNAQFLKAASEPHQSTNIELLKIVTSQAPEFAPGFRRLGEESHGEEALTALHKAVNLAPYDFRNSESLGDALMAQNKPGAAVQAYEAAVASLRHNYAFISSKPEWLQNLEAKQTLARGTGLLGHEKRNSNGWFLVGKGLFQQKRLPEAIQAFDNALSLNPGNAEARIMRFELALQTLDWQTMQAYQGTIAGLANSHAHAACLWGLAQMHQRAYGAATQSLHRAIAMAPHQGEAYDALVQTQLRMAELASVNQRRQLEHQAQTTLRQGMAQVSNPQEKNALAIQLALLLLKSGKAEEALPIVDAALSRNMIDGAAWSAKGQAQFEHGDFVAARDTLENALILNPNDARSLLQLGRVAQQEDRLSLAMEYYQKAYKANPMIGETSDALRDLMTRQHVAGRQPPSYWALSDDEHDYLVQVLHQYKSLTQQILSVLTTLNALPGRGGKLEFSERGIAAAEQIRPNLSKIAQKVTTLNTNFQTTAVPRRFTLISQALQGAASTELDALHIGINRMPGLENTAQEMPSAEFLNMLKLMNRPFTSMQLTVQMMAANLPETVLQSLLSEAQLGELNNLSRECQSLSQSLRSKAEKEKSQSAQKQAAPELHQSPSAVQAATEKMLKQSPKSVVNSGPANPTHMTTASPPANMSLLKAH
jgi:tetratricopeptide (TPR) repeat protein